MCGLFLIPSYRTIILKIQTCAHYAFKIAYFAFEQCSENLLIMLQLCSRLSHYALNMQVQF